MQIPEQRASLTERIFRPFTGKVSTIEKIGIVFFHVITGCIPLILYHGGKAIGSCFPVFSSTTFTEYAVKSAAELERVQREANALTDDQIIDALHIATSFPRERFYDLSSDDLRKFAPVALELRDSKKLSKEIESGISEEGKKTYARFSKLVFSIPESLSLHLSVNTNKLQMFTHIKEAALEEGEGTNKKSKATKEGKIIRGVVLTGRENIVEDQKRGISLIKTKLQKGKWKYFSIPELVTYKSKKTGKMKHVFLSYFMNKRDLAHANYNIPQDQVKQVLIDLAIGMRTMHQAGLVHLDLKGNNILLEEKNGVYKAQISDFDFVKEAASGHKIPEYSQLYPHLPPEWEGGGIARGDALKQADVFAFGKILEDFVEEGHLSESQNEKLFLLSRDMTNPEKHRRPTMEKVVQELGLL